MNCPCKQPLTQSEKFKSFRGAQLIPTPQGATLCDRPFCFFTKKSERSKVRFDVDDVNLLDILILIFLCCID